MTFSSLTSAEHRIFFLVRRNTHRVDTQYIHILHTYMYTAAHVCDETSQRPLVCVFFYCMQIMEMCANIWRLNSALPQPRADGQTDTPKTIKAALDMHETDVHCRACHMTQVNAREPEHLSVPRPQTISVAAWGRRRTSEWCRCCYVVVQKSLFYMDPWWQFYRRLKCLIWRFQSYHRPFFFFNWKHMLTEWGKKNRVGGFYITI